MFSISDSITVYHNPLIEDRSDRGFESQDRGFESRFWFFFVHVFSETGFRHAHCGMCSQFLVVKQHSDIRIVVCVLSFVKQDSDMRIVACGLSFVKQDSDMRIVACGLSFRDSNP